MGTMRKPELVARGPVFAPLPAAMLSIVLFAEIQPALGQVGHQQESARPGRPQEEVPS